MGIEQRSNAGARPVPGASPAGTTTMRAAVQHRYGPPSVLESSEVGLPLPSRGEVLVQVGAASVHPGDYFVMTGRDRDEGGAEVAHAGEDSVEGRPGMAATASITTTRACARPDLPPLRRTDRASRKKNR